jgi:hypothetical protein
MHDLASGRDEILEELMDESEELEANDELEFEEYEGDEELASQLLEVTSDEELDYFFGKILKGAKRIMKSPAGKLLGGALKGIAKKALPIAGSALGNFIAPGVGGAVGGKLAGMLGSMFETEGVSDEDVQMEVARRVVKTARQAAARVSRDPRSGSNPRAAVQAALADALKRNLPGLIAAPGNAIVTVTAPRSGRWYRRGNRIVIVGV